ncbi:hypothetical protein D3C84_1154610 [compost metagenome]
MVISTPPNTVPKPLGMKPPLSHSRLTPDTSASGQKPNTARLQTTMKAMIATTLTSANQYSKAPKFFTLIRLVPDSTSMIRKANSQDGTPGK